MKISVISATVSPVDVISKAAGTSYGKDDASEKRVLNCFKLGHLSVFEHATFTVRIEGISRACSHQLVRHRLASFVQQSQRYTKIDVDCDDWYVIPEAFQGDSKAWYRNLMYECAIKYKAALRNDVKPEDARYLLPEATKTTITMTMNARELFTFLDLRTDKDAQWEIRNMANELIKVLSAHDEQWRFILNLWQGKYDKR